MPAHYKKVPRNILNNFYRTVLPKTGQLEARPIEVEHFTRGDMEHVVIRYLDTGIQHYHVIDIRDPSGFAQVYSRIRPFVYAICRGEVDPVEY